MPSARRKPDSSTNLNFFLAVQDRTNMAILPQPFVIGHLYSNERISECLGVGNAGGIRPSLDGEGEVRRLVLMTAISTAKVEAENPYHDRIENDVLIYTGTGRQGDQQPTGLNRRLTEQSVKRFPIWCFRQEFNRRDKTVGNDRWRFLGLLTLLRYYPEKQIDTTRTARLVWVFEFEISIAEPTVTVENDERLTIALFSRPAGTGVVDRSPVVATVPGDVATELEALRCKLLSLDPRSFELLVQRTLKASGYMNVEVTRYSQDGGIDVNASFGTAAWSARECRAQVQAKRWLHTVGRKEVAELRGSLQSDGIGCLITTSHFSRAALTEAVEPGKFPITLVNGHQFASILVAFGIDPSSSA